MRAVWWAVVLAGCADRDRFVETPAWANPAPLQQPEPSPAPELVHPPTPGATLTPGSVVGVRMIATNPRGEEETKDAVVFWPWVGLPDVRDADVCAHCIQSVPSRHADVVLHPGTLGIPEAWLSTWQVGDVVKFSAPPPAWTNFNARERSFFRTTTGTVRWEVTFACSADLRAVSMHFAGINHGTPLNLPDGKRVARWYEFHGCRDGQALPAGATFAVDAAHLKVERE